MLPLFVWWLIVHRPGQDQHPSNLFF